MVSHGVTGVTGVPVVTQSEVKGVTWCYRDKGVTVVTQSKVKGITWCYRVLQWIKVLQLLHRVKLKVLHGVTRCYTDSSPLTP